MRTLGRLVAVGSLALSLFAPSSAAAQQSTNHAVPKGFCGNWGHHGSSMQISCDDNFPETAFGIAQQRSYRDCDRDGPRCDLNVGHIIGSGSIASFVVQRADGADDSKVTIITTARSIPHRQCRQYADLEHAT